MRHVCYCGSRECPPAQCRFAASKEEFRKIEAEFWKDWAEAQRRLDAGEKEVSV